MESHIRSPCAEARGECQAAPFLDDVTSAMPDNGEYSI